MKTIYITGETGFIGNYLINKLSRVYSFCKHNRNSNIKISQEVVIHLAGISHDLKNINKPDDYYSVNTDFTKLIFDSFLSSNAKVFIALIFR